MEPLVILAAGLLLAAAQAADGYAAFMQPQAQAGAVELDRKQILALRWHREAGRSLQTHKRRQPLRFDQKAMRLAADVAGLYVAGRGLVLLDGKTPLEFRGNRLHSVQIGGRSQRWELPLSSRTTAGGAGRRL